jgi:transposase
MRKKIDVLIQETEPELQKLIRNEQNRLKLHRLSALYLLKTGQARTYSAIGKLLGYERHTISAWFERYKATGLKGLLAVEKPGPKEKTKISKELLERLRQQLEAPDSSLRTYKQIQQWLNDEMSTALSYSTVHSIVRYEFGLDLKRLRRHREGSFASVS